jgi:DnaK suppressor protein
MAVKKVAKKKKAANSKGPVAKKTVRKATKKPVAKKSAVRKKPAQKSARVKVTKSAGKATTDNKDATQKPRLSAAMQKRNALLIKLLLKKRNEVVNGLESQMGRKLIRESGQKIDSAMDSADLSALDMDQGIDYSLLEMKYEQYKDIADAFRKLENNTYGQCEECGEEIDIKRLGVNPLARFCISCKMKKEEMERIQKEETRFKE